MKNSTHFLEFNRYSQEQFSESVLVGMSEKCAIVFNSKQNSLYRIFNSKQNFKSELIGTLTCVESVLLNSRSDAVIGFKLESKRTGSLLTLERCSLLGAIASFSIELSFVPNVILEDEELNGRYFIADNKNYQVHEIGRQSCFELGDVQGELVSFRGQALVEKLGEEQFSVITIGSSSLARRFTFEGRFLCFIDNETFIYSKELGDGYEVLQCQLVNGISCTSTRLTQTPGIVSEGFIFNGLFYFTLVSGPFQCVRRLDLITRELIELETNIRGEVNLIGESSEYGFSSTESGFFFEVKSMLGERTFWRDQDDSLNCMGFVEIDQDSIPRFELFSFSNLELGHHFQAQLLVPSQGVSRTLISVHGGPENLEVIGPRYGCLYPELLARGVAIVILNYPGSRGLGHCHRTSPWLRWKSSIIELASDLQNLLNKHCLAELPIDFFGPSFGAAYAVHLAATVERSERVFGVSPLVDLELQERKYLQSDELGFGNLDWFQKRFSFQDFEDFSVEGFTQAIVNSGVELHLRQGAKDLICSVELTRELVNNCQKCSPQDVSFALIPDLGHSAISEQENYEQTQWLLSYFDVLPTRNADHFQINC